MRASELIGPIGPDLGNVILPGADQWMQGRTLYGGASALIAYTAATRAFPGLPPLRAAQIGFVGPVGPEMALGAEIVREGRNVTQIASEIRCEGKVVLRALWLFGAAREANAVHPAAGPDPWPGPPEAAEPVMVDKGADFIRHNFELRRGQEQSGPGAPVMRRWLRLREPSGLDPVAELVLLGDTMPPGAVRAMRRQGPISSINWAFNVLDPAPATRDGWWLAEAASEHAGDGYSSERLRLWNAAGQQMLGGLQAVAVFG